MDNIKMLSYFGVFYPKFLLLSLKCNFFFCKWLFCSQCKLRGSRKGFTKILGLSYNYWSIIGEKQMFLYIFLLKYYWTYMWEFEQDTFKKKTLTWVLCNWWSCGFRTTYFGITWITFPKYQAHFYYHLAFLSLLQL